jgi:DNA-binding response OmpR family regulator
MHAVAPHALIVDDDTITLRFFKAAFRELGWTCATCGDGASAIASRGDYALLVIDRNLPDISGDALLATLRSAHVTTPAIATSAEVDTTVREALIGAGFAGVVAKPVSVDALRAIVRRVTSVAANPPQLLDDADALAALGGYREGLLALRKLLADELVEIRSTNADADIDTFSGRLHRLRASCGFCGATALSDAAARLQSSLRESPDRSARERDAFFDLCDATASALRATASD